MTLNSSTVCRWLSVFLLCLALIGINTLLFSDGLHRFRFTASHQRLGALALILIGLSNICFQFSAPRPAGVRTKGLLLGLAFVLWGSEQLLPPGRWVTAMDSLVISIFVVDLALITFERLRRKDDETP